MMSKQGKIVLATFVMLMSAVFAQNARAGEDIEDDTWFKTNFSLVRNLETESAAFNQKTMKIYRSNRSGNCYAMQGGGPRGGFSQVPCEDFVSDADMEHEITRMQDLIVEQTESIIQRKKELDATIKKYNEAFR